MNGPATTAAQEPRRRKPAKKTKFSVPNYYTSDSDSEPEPSSLNRKVSFSIEDASASDACPDLVYDSSDSELDSVSPARAPGPARRSELSNSLYQTNIADAYLQAQLHIPDSFYVRANKSITAHHIDDSITLTEPDGANSIIDTPNTDSDYDSVPPLVQVSEASDSDDSVVNYLVRQRKKRADPVIRGPVNKPDTDSDDSAPGIVTRERCDSQSDSDFYDVPMSNLGGTPQFLRVKSPLHHLRMS